MTETKLNLHQKLVAVREANTGYLQKENEGFQFKFVSSSQVLLFIREELDKQNILLVPNITNHVVNDHKTKKGDHGYFTELVIMFSWINADTPDDKIECMWYGQGLDSGEKGVGKALTYAEKYFILKFFNIATDKDDPDAHQKKQEQKEQKKQATQSVEDLQKIINELLEDADADYAQKVVDRINQFKAKKKYTVGKLNNVIKRIKEDALKATQKPTETEQKEEAPNSVEELKDEVAESTETPAENSSLIDAVEGDAPAEQTEPEDSDKKDFPVNPYLNLTMAEFHKKCIEKKCDLEEISVTITDLSEQERAEKYVNIYKSVLLKFNALDDPSVIPRSQYEDCLRNFDAAITEFRKSVE